MEENFFQKGS